jgi:ssRNA-specific RNase YbeY (16S rRNA maturation enzyme)
MKILLEEKILGTHSKKNSKYYWVLETITGKNEVTQEFVEEDFQMTCSETGYIQNIKEEILEKINSENVFSFPYEPKEGDYLSIKNNLRKNEYLNMIFMNNLWVEEIYMCSYRDCEGDIYTTIKTGVAFLSENEIYF